ncbi:MAG TPA: integrin [Flavobacteriaceae bacterium]|nr:integrin [Flavobacteriaceae bacterium]HBR53419.1 integrin [Flavobacteriaceae bacterium]|tara:strand:+ start:203 stop:1942 length:1740 start_codon:yes stop_codon:yes gene_type:complete
MFLPTKILIEMNRILLLVVLFCTTTLIAQVGINTTDPQGTLDVTSVNNTGLVLPRVTSVEEVTDGNGGDPVEGTTVFDISRSSTCFYQSGKWVCIGSDSSGNPVLTDVEPPVFDMNSTIDYVKASNTGGSDIFGYSLSISGDGLTLVVGAYLEDSNATGINGTQTNNTAGESGAVYIFTKTGATWSQEAYIKSSNTGNGDFFGISVAVSGDGNTVAVGAYYEDSNAAGINGDQTNNSGINCGAVYLFSKSGGIWSQEAYVKSSNPDPADNFGIKVALNSNGTVAAASALREASNATGINGDQSNNSAASSGAVYVFRKTGGSWGQEAYMKASNTDAGDQFGSAIDISGTGNTIIVGSYGESSNTNTINGNENDNSSNQNGAAYIFQYDGSSWSQEAYLKASNSEAVGNFGFSVSLSSTGDTAAVGSRNHSSTGAAYIFDRSGSAWSETAYLQASDAGVNDSFGYSVDLSTDGKKLAVGAYFEDSNAIGIDGDGSNNSLGNSGATYIFSLNGGTWSEEAYIKTSNTAGDDRFGYAVSLDADGNVLVSSAILEDSNATGVNGDQTNNSLSNSGAVYIYTAN